MSNLYGNQLAKVFDKMYQGFIDYHEEYEFYKLFCKKFKKEFILEIGCGTGNLAPKFSLDFKSYLGIDLSETMLSIAKEKFPSGEFQQADMTHFELAKKRDAVLITGRTISYLITNKDINNCFSSIYNALLKNGLLIFDCIDASKFIPIVEQKNEIKHYSSFENKNYVRESLWFWEKEKENFMINWNANYFEIDVDKNNFLGNDKVDFRVFTQCEIKLFLKQNNFEILEIRDRKSYAFDTFVVVAQKKS